MIKEQASNNEKLYDSILDVLDDDVFPETDYRLRAGVNITDEYDHLHSFLQQAETELTKYYQKFYLSLECTNEGVYFLQPQRRTLIPKSRLDQLTMVIGLTIVAMQLDKSAADYEWLTTGHLIERLRSQLSDSRFADLYRRKGVVKTEFDQSKVLAETTKRLSILSRLNFLNLSKDKTSFWPTAAIYRFVEPLRGLRDESELAEKIESLSREGYLIASPAPSEKSNNVEIDTEHWSENLNHRVENMDMFSFPFSTEKEENE
ncbi:chromosome partition protein MukE [Pseudoalteromonas sp. G4]|uniref:chromosome partition protein MukE n=1 Tax=Pseudoalteromonas sp. G4 TaxID=2992761 RepID=UPI00237D794D|nr:chromosome partition protein MukE [Pseudoalteromonas sp. G4]MDE3271526.1 chromosome partition protein MukE [Pseudoalteromonas sp. G4]